MITLPDGTPWFEQLFSEIKHGDQEHQDWLHNKLREWSAQRRCVNCLHFDNIECTYLNIDFTELPFSEDMAKPETFSCAAFEEKHGP